MNEGGKEGRERGRGVREGREEEKTEEQEKTEGKMKHIITIWSKIYNPHDYMIIGFLTICWQSMDSTCTRPCSQ